MKNILIVTLFLFSFNSNSQNLDFDILKKVNHSYTIAGGGIMRFISDGDTYVAFGIPVGLFTAGKINKDKQMVYNSYESVSAQLINGVITTVLKTTISRPRPFVTYPNDIQKHSVAGSKSFPSGHTSMAFATATTISLQYPKWFIIAPAYLWASTVGYSRMYLGVHYPSDVIAGAVLGAGSSLLTHYTFKYIQKRIEAKKTKEKI